MSILNPGPSPAAALEPNVSGLATLRLLNRYHWFVFTVAALGWLADCMDQQLFNLARVSAVTELLQAAYVGEQEGLEMEVKGWAGFYTSIFLIGWATGGIVFGIMGDRFGRVRTM